MTPLALDLYAWLAQKEGVSELRDASDCDYGDAIRCCFGGQAHLITVSHADTGEALTDPREDLADLKRGL